MNKIDEKAYSKFVTDEPIRENLSKKAKSLVKGKKSKRRAKGK